jgi:hypothetical protein
MFTQQPGLAGLKRPNAEPAQNATRLQIGRVVGVHADTDQIDVALLGGGRINNVPILSPLAGRNVGAAGLPPIASGLENATASGGDDSYVVIGYLRGQAELPVALGFLGPKDSNLIKRPDGSNLRRDVGGQVHVAYPSGIEEHHYAGGGVVAIGTDQPTDLDPALLPPDGDPTIFYLTNGMGGLLIDQDGLVNLTAPGGFLVNNAPVGGYTLPIASPTVLGGIKVGSNLSIDGSGVLSATATPYTLPIASAGALGGVKVGSGLAIDGAGVLSATYSYTLPIASAGVLGGVKVGSGLAIDGAGVLSVPGLLTGSGVAGRVAFWDGGASLSSDDALLWDSTNNKLTVNGDRIVVNSAGANAGINFAIGGVNKWTPAAYQGSGSSGNIDFTFYNEQTNSAGMFIDGDNNSVGINTTTPGANLPAVAPILHVNAPASNTQSAIVAGGNRTGSDGGVGQLAGYNAAATGTDRRVGLILFLRENDDNSGGMSFYARNAGTIAEAMRISRQGYLGVGVTAPVFPFETKMVGVFPALNINEASTSARRATIGFGVNGATANTGWIMGQGLNNTTAKDFYLNDLTAGATRLYIDTTGYVGIGAAAASYPLDVRWSLNSGAGAIVARNTNSGSGAYTQMLLGNDADAAGAGMIRLSSANTAYAGANSLMLWTVGAHPIAFATNNSVRMRITSDGSIALGVLSIPLGQFHTRDTNGANLLMWSHTAVGGTEIVIVPASQGYSNNYFAIFSWGARGNTSGGVAVDALDSIFIPTSGSGSVTLTVDSSTFMLRFYSTGAVTVQRTAGSATARIALWLHLF